MSNTSTTTTTHHTPKHHAPGAHQDRYGGVIATKLDGACSPEEIPGIVAELRANFNADKTLSKEWRVDQLKALLRMLTDARAELRRGMKVDLHKSEIEGDLTELDLVATEANHALDHLDEWMAPTATGSTALNIPCWSEIKPDPLGVILIMGAWNYPMQLTLAPLVGAIAAGNCVLVKPGSYAVESSHILCRLIKKFMDPATIRCVEGNRDVTDALLNQKFDKICFTGSTYVGTLIAQAAAKTLTPVMLELGGKSPTIVDKSANIEHAAKRIVWGSFMNAGQTCVRPDFGLIHDDIADKFFAEAKKAVVAYYGTEAEKTEYFGRIINDTAVKRLCALQEKEKSRICVGSGRNDPKNKFVEPTIFDFKGDFAAFSASPLMTDEIFGPLFPCVRYKKTEDAIQFIRKLPTGKPLAMYLFSTDNDVNEQFVNRTSAGGMVINDCLMHLANHELPFGGVGNSGLGGGYHGHHSFVQFSHQKALLKKYPTIDQLFFVKPLLELRFPPYDTKVKQVILPLLANYTVGKIAVLDFPYLRKLLLIVLAYLMFRKAGFRIVME